MNPVRDSFTFCSVHFADPDRDRIRIYSNLSAVRHCKILNESELAKCRIRSTDLESKKSELLLIQLADPDHTQIRYYMHTAQKIF